MSDEPGAILMLVNEQRTFIDQNDHTWVCIHKTAGGSSAQNIATFFANDPAMASSHYVVGQDGTIVQVVLEKDGAAANCCLETGHAAYLPLGVNLNVKTVSIEHVDPATDNSTLLTEAQKAASFRLVHAICLRHNIPMRKGDASGGIIGHHDIAPLSRARCPGAYPWDELFTYLQGGGTMSIDLTNPSVAAYFKQGNGDAWDCIKTGKSIALGMLAYYRTNGAIPFCGLSSLGLPASNEIPIEQVGPAFAHLAGNGIVVQYFERGVLVYDAKHLIDKPPGSGSVYPLHLYNGGAGTDPRIAQQQAQIAALQSQVAPIADARVARYEQIKNIVDAIV